MLSLSKHDWQRSQPPFCKLSAGLAQGDLLRDHFKDPKMNIAMNSHPSSFCRPTLLLLSLLLFGVGSAFLSCSDKKQSEPPKTPEQIQGALIRQLIMMADQEQQSRDRFDSIINEKGWRSPEGQTASRDANLLDSVNTAQLEEIIAKNGWPGKSLVGNQAAMAAFIVLQHSSIEIQEKYLPMVEAAAAKGEIERAHLAMLQDRILMRRDKPQKYGTQLWNDPSTGKLGLYPIEDSSGVDLRRAEVGLPPIYEYLKQIGINPDSLTQRPKTEIIINAGGDSAK